MDEDTAGCLSRESGNDTIAIYDAYTSLISICSCLDKTKHKHPDLLKSGAIIAFNDYFEDSRQQGEILNFVRGLLDAKSPKTKKLAQEFLAR